MNAKSSHSAVQQGGDFQESSQATGLCKSKYASYAYSERKPNEDTESRETNVSSCPWNAHVARLCFNWLLFLRHVLSYYTCWSGMLYRTDSKEDLAEEEGEEPGLFGDCLHPKIRKHWRMFLASIGLLTSGIVFLGVATAIAFMPAKKDGSDLHSYVFFICGLICLIPGVYYFIYICRAAKGEKGYKMEDIPTFSN